MLDGKFSFVYDSGKHNRLHQNKIINHVYKSLLLHRVLGQLSPVDLSTCNSFIDTNLIHNFLCKLHKIKFLYMFRASSAHLQEVNDVNCTCMQPLIFSFSAGGRLVHLLRGVFP